VVPFSWRKGGPYQVAQPPKTGPYQVAHDTHSSVHRTQPRNSGVGGLTDLLRASDRW